jgi:hypothetical protein
MIPAEIARRRQKLDALYKRVAVFTDDADQAHWARYLCVLTSGFIELSVRTILSEYARNKAAPYVSNYVQSQLSDFQNPKMEKILDLVGSFNDVWEAELRSAADGELKDSVDSIVANKNRIAHGDDVGITYVRMDRYYKNAIKVIELMAKGCR